MIEVAQPKPSEYVYEPVEENINNIFFEVLWKPLLEVLEKYDYKQKLSNSTTVGVLEIVDAMKTRQIEMRRNEVSCTFVGTFDSKLTKAFKKLGATWNKKEKSYNISYDDLPQEINAAQGQITVEENRMMKDMIDSMPQLDDVKQLVEDNKKYLLDNMGRAIEDYEGDWKKASRKLAVQPDFTPEQRKAIAEAYTNNLNLYVTDFSASQIKEMRFIMEEGISNGNRASSMVNELQGRYSISQNKAKFLAKQETRLLSTQYLHQRATVCGVKKFRWSTAHDSRVRDLHKHLDRKIFTMDNLPVIYEGKSGEERGMPGQTFGCRCRAIYLFED